MDKGWEELRQYIKDNPVKNTTVVARIPGPRDESSGVMRSGCDGIYPIRQRVIKNAHS